MLYYTVPVFAFINIAVFACCITQCLHVTCYMLHYTDPAFTCYTEQVLTCCTSLSQCLHVYLARLCGGGSYRCHVLRVCALNRFGRNQEFSRFHQLGSLSLWQPALTAPLAWG